MHAVDIVIPETLHNSSIRYNNGRDFFEVKGAGTFEDSSNGWAGQLSAFDRANRVKPMIDKGQSISSGRDPSRDSTANEMNEAVHSIN